MTRLGKFNGKGISRFQDYLESLTKTPTLAPPREMLETPGLLEEFPGAVDLDGETNGFSRLDLMNFLAERLNNIDAGFNEGNKGLWAWLSLYYFDLVCPANANGERKPGRLYRHIPEFNDRNRHRHLLGGPFQIHTNFNRCSSFLLFGPVEKESQIFHELVSRQEFISNPGIMEAALLLYFNPNNKSPKKGVLSKKRPGNLYRFVDVLQQFNITFDLYSLEPENIIGLLPAEFSPWLEDIGHRG